jgi:Na+/proline symporter
MEILTLLAIFIIVPFAATLIGAIYLWMFYKLRTKSSMLAGVLWVLYSIYEYLMYIRVLCTGECNIRVDLLGIYPLLLVASITATILYYSKKRKINKAEKISEG